jgi:hypothetical protein
MHSNTLFIPTTEYLGVYIVYGNLITMIMRKHSIIHLRNRYICDDNLFLIMYVKYIYMKRVMVCVN